MKRLTYRDANGEAWYSDAGTERDRLHRLTAIEDILCDCYIQPGDSASIDTGVHIQLPPNTTGEVVCKSGLNVNHGLICSGLVDEGYTGSIVIKLYNLSNEPYYIKAGDKIAQLVIRPVLYLSPVQVDKIQGGERGNNGFGSTGR